MNFIIFIQPLSWIGSAPFDEFGSNTTEFDEFSAGGGTERRQFELAITQRFEVDFQKLGHFWKAESQGFPTAAIGAYEDITCLSYEHFEIIKKN